MGKDAAGTGEAARRHGQWQLGQGLLFQGLHQDALQAAHVDEVHGEGLAAGGVQALGGVALAQAQELVSLADLGLGHPALEETLGEFVHRWSQLGRLALDVVGRPGGVG